MKFLHIAAVLAMVCVPGIARADVNAALDVVRAMMVARYHPCTPSPNYQCPPAYHYHSTPLYATPSTWDRSTSDLSRYHLSTPSWSKSTQEPIVSQSEGECQRRFYAPYAACPAPPRIGFTTPELILRSIRGW